jgi:hypothetical protein
VESVPRYLGRRISDIVGDFYQTAGISNGFQQGTAETLLERVNNPDSALRAVFEKEGIRSEILEWRCISLREPFPHSIKIELDSKLVYSADVSLHDPSIHLNQIVSEKNGWVQRIIQFTEAHLKDHPEDCIRLNTY